MIMHYKGYRGFVEYDKEDKIFVGKVKLRKWSVIFQGDTVQSLEKDLAESMEEYFEICEEEGVEPEKPFSGKFVLRLNPKTHAEITEKANEQGISLNQLCEKVLREYVHG